MEGIFADFRSAARRLWKPPGFTLAAVIPLALGIGLNTAIFNVVHGVLLRPLPFPEPDALVALCGVWQRFWNNWAISDFRGLYVE